MNFSSSVMNLRFLSLSYIASAVIAGCLAISTNECSAESESVECYECSTVDGSSKDCGDPFNTTSIGLRSTKCDGACVKWVVHPVGGERNYIRTCSTTKTIEFKITIALVCMKESRSGEGELCFCRENLCNRANSTRNPLHVALFPLLVTLFLQRPSRAPSIMFHTNS